MLDLDKGAMTELLEMEAAPVCNTLGGLLGRSCRVTVADIMTVDVDSFAGYLPRFNVTIEGTAKGEDAKTSQLYVFGREDMVRLTNFIMGIPIDRDSPLDQVALSTLKEVASQCVNAANAEMGDFLGRNMEECLTKVSAWDTAEQIEDQVRRLNVGEHVILVRFQVTIDGIFTSEVFRVASENLPEVFGIPALAVNGNNSPEDEEIRKPGKAIAVQEVVFPEFKYAPLEYTTEHISEERKLLGDITLEVSVQIGGTVCSVKDILNLKEGEILTLDKQAGSPADVVVNGKLIGRGDVLVSDDKFSTRIIEIVDKRD